MPSTRHRGIRVAVATLGLTGGLLAGTASAASADSAQEAADSSAAECRWTPRKPKPWWSGTTGWVRAKLEVSGCSRNADWNGQLERWTGIYWDTVDELNWRGNADQWLLDDCEDGGRSRYRSRMEDMEGGAVKHSGAVNVTCPNG